MGGRWAFQVNNSTPPAGLSNRLRGGFVADIIGGGTSTDTLTCGGGADVFFFKSMNPASTAPSCSLTDTITDFSQSDGDTISLTGIDANTTAGGNQTFSFVGESAFSRTAGELPLCASRGQTVVEMDRDGDGVTGSVPEPRWSGRSNGGRFRTVKRTKGQSAGGSGSPARSISGDNETRRDAFEQS